MLHVKNTFGRILYPKLHCLIIYILDFSLDHATKRPKKHHK